MNVVISGASGFIGRNVIAFLKSNGHVPVIIIRSELIHDNNARLVEKINGSYAVINLAGSPVSKRWTRKTKRDIYHSRVNTTRCIVEAISKCEKRPEILINASAIGIYDDKHFHDEESKYLTYNYLGKVVRDWEYVAGTALEYGVSVSIMRFGIVLGKDGGMLKKILPLFRLGLGGKIGNGKQFMSCIHMDDLTNIMYQILINKLPHGTYNIVSPEINSNEDFTKKISKILQVPVFFTVPSFVLKAIYGEGSLVLMSGQNVVPAKLIENGYQFKFPTLKQALESILKKEN